MKQHIGRKLFRSYLLIMILAVVFNVLVCIFSAVNIYDGIQSSHENISQKLSEQLNQFISEGIGQTVKAGNTTSVLSVLEIEIDQYYFGQQARDMKILLEEFAEILKYCDALSSLSLYDVKQEALISRNKDNTNTVCHGDDTGRYLRESMHIPQAVLEKIMKNARLNFQIVAGEDGMWKAYYIMNLYVHQYSRPDGVLFGEIAMDKVQEMIDMYNYKDNNYYLASSDMGYLGTDASASALVSMLMTRNFQDHRAYWCMDGYRMLICSKVDTIHPELFCYYVSSVSGYYGTLLAAVLVMLVNLVAVLAVSILMARRFARNTTDPLKRILTIVEPGVDADKKLTWNDMEELIGNVVDKKRSFEKFWKNDFVALILNGQETSVTVIHEYMEKHTEVAGGSFILLCIRLLNISEQSDRDILLFCISNIIGELLDKANVGSPVKGWDCVYFIIRNDCDLDIIRRIVCEGTEFMNSRLTINVAMGFSSIFEDYVDLPRAKKEADYSAEYARLCGMEKNIAVYDVITEASGSDDKKYGGAFRGMIQKLGIHDYKAARELLDQIWQEHINQAYPEIMLRQARMMSILSVITVYYRENKGLLSVDEVQSMNILEMKNLAYGMLAELSLENDEDKKGRRAFEKISAYIKENYGDMNLSAGYISEHFSVSYSYLRELFKKYSGDSVPDYIHKVRIDAAKDLLKNGKTVNQAAVDVGYTDARGLIRAFKKYEGVTPGQTRFQ